MMELHTVNGNVQSKPGIDSKHRESVEELEAFVPLNTVKADHDEENGIDSGSTYRADRETWSNQLEFVLSVLGFAVGLGNIWRFPYLCMKNGGGAFLVPFLICLVTCGIPLLFLEVSLGQFLGKDCIKVWAMFPLVKGIGYGMFLLNILVLCYYVMIMAWSMYYFANSFESTLPWSTCSNVWNTENCVVRGRKMTYLDDLTNATSVTNSTSVFTLINATTPDDMTSTSASSQIMSAEEEYWQYKVLNLSDGLEHYGDIQWHLVLTLFLTWVVLFLCVIRGVKSIGKIVYVTALMPYVLLTTFLIRGLTLEGSLDGVLYFIKPDPAKLRMPSVWIEAALQVFFSLGSGWGNLIVMASHNEFNHNCLRNALIVSFVGEGTSVYSGLVVFTILGFIAHELGLPIEKVVKSGPGLGFVAYPQALARLPIPQFWSVLFFLMLLTVGVDSVFFIMLLIVAVDSQFPHVECILTVVTNRFPRSRRWQSLVLMGICLMGFLCGLPMTFQGGLYFFQLFDWYIAILSIPVFGFLEIVVISWFYGLERYSQDVTLMIGRGIPVLIRLCLGFIAPFIIACCFVFTLWMYAPPVYGGYHYSAGGQLIGWTIAVIPVCPIMFCAAHYLITNRREPLQKTLARSLHPGKDWKPNSRELRDSYKQDYDSYSNMTIFRRVKVNILGE